MDNPDTSFIQLPPTQVRVPNIFPTQTNVPYRIAIIGEAPGEEEVERRIPFVGASGRLLDVVLEKSGINRNACLVANICQFRPPNNVIEKFSPTGPERTLGMAQLKADLEAFQPNICVLLGNTPLRAALQSGPGVSVNISDWRGSLFRGNIEGSPFYGRKCIAALHPAYLIRGAYGYLPLLRADLGRARQQGTSPNLVLPNRVFDVELTADEVVSRIESIQPGTKTAVDIEGWADKLGIRCISISTDPRTGFILAFEDANGDNKYSLEDETKIWIAFSKLMWDRSIPKVLQNAMYDRFVLAWLCGILIRNTSDDTMVKHWEIYCELEKELGMITSLYTLQPYYKGDWKSKGTRLYNYCCMDSAVTLEACSVMEKLMTPDDWQHYNFNMQFLEALFYLELRGIAYDQPRADALKTAYQQKAYELQDNLNLVAGRQLRFPDQESAFEYIVGLIAFKKSTPNSWDDLPGCTKKEWRDDAPRIAFLGKRIPDLLASEWGELSYLLGSHLNVMSTAKDSDMQWFLYTKLQYPVQYKKEAGRKTETVTTDVNAVLKLFVDSNAKDRVLLDVLRLRSHLGKVTTLSAKTDTDGRIRGAFNGVGSETGRVQVSKSPTGSGFNLQTVTSELRVNFTADPDYDMFQVDLAGADGVTVAAWALHFGDPTMWDDYQYGIKPANVISLTYEFGPEVLQMDRAQLKWASKMVNKDGWIYFACKQVQHGSSYKMGHPTMSDNILKQSYKKGGDPIYVAPKVCGVLQGYFFMRYWGIPKWQDYVAETVLKTSKLRSASGHTRKFLGRKRENGVLNHDTWKQALSDEPQNNTTYATNLPILRMYTDPENRQKAYQHRGPHTKRNMYPGALIIEPLHQVHDASLGQWPKSERDWARAKVKSYFHNELTIAHRKVIIPFEGNYGPNWGELKEAI